MVENNLIGNDKIRLIEDSVQAINKVLTASANKPWAKVFKNQVGFYDSYDILFLFRLHNEMSGDSLVYSFFNNIWFDTANKLAYLKHIEKYSKFETVTKQFQNNVRILIPGGVFVWDIPKNRMVMPCKWIDFLKSFYSKYCSMPADVTILLDFIFLTIRVLLCQAPLIMETTLLNHNYLFVGYFLNDYTKEIIELKGLPITFVTVDKELLEKKINTNKTEENFFILLESLIVSSINVANKKRIKFDELKINLDLSEFRETFDYGFFIPKFLFDWGLLMPVLFRMLLENTLRLPYLVDQLSKKDEILLRNIVNNEFEGILYFLLKDIDQTHYLLNYLINKKKIEQNENFNDELCL